MTLFKYCKAEHGLSIIQNRTLKVSTPKSLNDPYEIIAHAEFTFEELKQVVLHSRMRDGIIQSIKRRGAPISTPAEYYDNYLRNRKEIDRNLRERTEELKGYFIDYSDKLDVNVGLFCVSTNPLSNLMWAHYADGSQGLCIGLDLSTISEDAMLFEVRYSDNRPAITARDLMEDGRLQDKLFEIYTTKSLDWQYESEYRFIFSLVDIPKQECRNGNYWLCPIKSSMIRDVYFGLRTTAETKDTVQAAIMQSGFKHIRLFQVAYDKKGKYRLVPEIKNEPI